MRNILLTALLITLSLTAFGDSTSLLVGSFTNLAQEEFPCTVKFERKGDAETQAIITVAIKDGKKTQWVFEGSFDGQKVLATDSGETKALVGGFDGHSLEAKLIEKGKEFLGDLSVSDPFSKKVSEAKSVVSKTIASVQEKEAAAAQKIENVENALIHHTPQTTAAKTTQSTQNLAAQTFSGSFVDDDGEIETLSVEVSGTGENTTFVFTRTENDGERKIKTYVGSLVNGAFRAKKLNDGFTPDVIKGSIKNGVLEGSLYDDGIKLDGTFRATQNGQAATTTTPVATAPATTAPVTTTTTPTVPATTVTSNTGSQKYAGTFIDDDGEVETLTVEIIGDNDNVSFIFTRTENDGETKRKAYTGTIANGTFRARKVNDGFMPDVVKGTIQNGVFEGTLYDDGITADGTFRATLVK